MSESGPFVVVTSILDSAARPAAITRCHGEAMERAFHSVEGKKIAGLDIVELSVAPETHAALRKHLGLPDDQAGVYDIFPLAATLTPDVRKAAAQFLAAESLWSLDAQGALRGVSVSVKLDLPKGWDRDPKEVHERLIQAGALDLNDQAIALFNAAKERWEQPNGAS